MIPGPARAGGHRDDGGADQNEDACADDRADAKRSQIPGREVFFKRWSG